MILTLVHGHHTASVSNWRFMPGQLVCSLGGKEHKKTNFFDNLLGNRDNCKEVL